MTQQEKFSLHLAYEPELAYIIRDEIVKVGTLKTINYNTSETHPLRLSVEYGDLEHEWMFKPYLRSFDQLTKPITQKDYNEGKPFVPALELIKLQEKYGKWEDIAPTIDYTIKIVKKSFGSILKVSKLDKWVLLLSLSEIDRAPFYIIQQLLKWHFQVGFEQGEYIEVNEENNPY